MGTATIVQCRTCGVERRPDDTEGDCPICADERQYLPPDGVQRWTDPAEQAAQGARIEVTDVEPGVHGLSLHDGCGIGQRPVVVESAAGNIMVEAPAFIDDAAVAAVRGLGGLAGIICSHPHMYGVQSLWSAAFDDAPVYVARADREWLAVRPANTVEWEGELRLADDLVASQPGGHFPGSGVVHWRGRDGRGVLFAGDTIMPVARRGWVTFLRSYPNALPMSAAVVRRIARHVARYDFDRLYNNFTSSVDADAAAAVQTSAERYAAWVSGDHDDLT